MGRSIPSFRQLIEIEKLHWCIFKKKLSSKEDKKTFDFLFENAELYSCYLSHANNPIPWQSIVMGMILHNYKTLLSIRKENTENGKLLKEKMNLLEKDNPKGKILFDKICKKWRGLLYTLLKEDEQPLQRMLIELCYNLNEETTEQMIYKDSKYLKLYIFIICILFYHQKILDNSEKSK